MERILFLGRALVHPVNKSHFLNRCDLSLVDGGVDDGPWGALSRPSL